MTRRFLTFSHLTVTPGRSAGNRAVGLPATPATPTALISAVAAINTTPCTLLACCSRLLTPALENMTLSKDNMSAVMGALVAALGFHAESGATCNTMHIFSATAVDVLGHAALGVHIDGTDGLGPGASLAFVDGLDVLTVAGLAQGIFVSPAVRKVRISHEEIAPPCTHTTSYNIILAIPPLYASCSELILRPPNPNPNPNPISIIHTFSPMCCFVCCVCPGE